MKFLYTGRRAFLKQFFCIAVATTLPATSLLSEEPSPEEKKRIIVGILIPKVKNLLDLRFVKRIKPLYRNLYNLYFALKKNDLMIAIDIIENIHTNMLKYYEYIDNNYSLRQNLEAQISQIHIIAIYGLP